MGIIKYVRRHTSKPVAGVGAEYNLSIFQGMTGFIPFRECGGKPNAIPGLYGTLSGTGTLPAWSTAQGEHAMKFNPAGDATPAHTFIDFGTPTNRFVNLAQGPMTLAARIWISGLASGGIAERNDANAVNVGWEWGISAGGGISFLAEFANQNLTATITGSGFQNRKWMTIAVTYNGPVLTPLTAVNFYVDGRGPQPPTASSNGVGTQGSDSARNFYLGRCTFVSQQFSDTGVFPGYIAWFAAWQRILSPGEMANLGQYPNLLFESIKRDALRIGTVPPVSGLEPVNFIVT